MPASLFSDDESPPPSPVLEHPKLRLNDLADPPTDWQFLGETVQVTMRARRFPKKRLETIVNHHSWGIDMGLAKRATIEKLLIALWKLLYHMAPDHLPTSFAELADFSRDAGPRLLPYTIQIERVPISRYYPQPPADSKALSLRFTRPSDAPASISDSYLERMSYPVSGGPVDLDATEDEEEEMGEEGQEQEQEQEQEKTRPVEKTKSPLRSASSRHSRISVVTQPFQPERHTARPLPAKNVVEIVQRVIMKLAHADLERHHTTAWAGHPCLVASEPQALLKILDRTVPATTQVRLLWNRETDEMTLHPDGRDYPYRGRGPVGTFNTSAIDCVIVAAKLLDAGSTVIDRCKKGWRAQLTPLESALIKTTEVDWDLCFTDESEMLRNNFWHVVNDSLPEVWAGDIPWLQGIWTRATSNFAQFHFTYYDQYRPCECNPDRERGDTTGPWRNTFMQPSEVPEDGEGPVTMQTRLAREFAFSVQVDCDVCDTPNAVTRWRTFESLPARLVAMVDPDVPVTKHTQDLTFEVETFAKRMSVTYRWVGGIYEYKGQFRVFWADNRPGEVDRGEVRMYDGSKSLGMIVGGLSYGHPSERVPDEWWYNKTIPLVFYERVDNVSPQVLNTVMSSVGSMVEAVENRMLLTDEVGPWAPSNNEVSEQPGQWVFPSADLFNIPPQVNLLASPISEQSYPLGMQDSPGQDAVIYSPPLTPRIEEDPASPPMGSIPSNPLSSLGLERIGQGETGSNLDYQAPSIHNLVPQPDLPASNLPTADLPEPVQRHPSDAELREKYGVNYTRENYMNDYYNAAMKVYYMMNQDNGNTGNAASISSVNFPQWNQGNMYGVPQYWPGNGSQLQTLQQFQQQQQQQQEQPSPSPRSNSRSRSHSGQGSAVGSDAARRPSRTSSQKAQTRRSTGHRNGNKRKRGPPDQKNKRKKRNQRFKKKRQAIQALAHRPRSRLQTPEGW
ncbi:uncharacterized protein KD926_008120 [Aspergillus affinis]|uniref:uncharacterized protein n=1 Tax=Aspergillus affinis TaxID=1070780 RepID=UPI0022FE2E6C|nr:uncharacterized protein KD926_008120 [Aspergillus affinis]KAI9040553.1 hypothetical protein KD926_008120 [Aspergillus affinis]